jgi:hypothetical protein
MLLQDFLPELGWKQKREGFSLFSSNISIKINPEMSPTNISSFYPSVDITFFSGLKEIVTTLYHPELFPFGSIGKVSIIFRLILNNIVDMPEHEEKKKIKKEILMMISVYFRITMRRL